MFCEPMSYLLILYTLMLNRKTEISVHSTFFLQRPMCKQEKDNIQNIIISQKNEMVGELA